MTHLPFLYLRPSKLGGRGVFTSAAIEEDSVVELAPVIVIPEQERARVHETVLHDYYFLWDGGGAALALGYGSLYNHAVTPNLDYALDYDFEQIKFTALRPIKAGEELLIDYMAGDDREGLWFAVKD